MTSLNRRQYLAFSDPFKLGWGFLCALVVAVSPAACAEPNPGHVGEATLVLGQSLRKTVHLERQKLLERGDVVRAGDQIETRSNGHVHLRFVDGAMVSVRPNSRLTIQRYDYDPDNPSASIIKFELEEGVTRSISGEAAKHARDRFRLNTPIAAIGVRGTDFVVSSELGTTRAMVNEGSIVLAPFSDVCTASGYGPCASNSLELRGGMFGLAALDERMPLPRLIPAQSVREPDFMQKEVQRAIVSSEGNDAQDPDLEAPATVDDTNSQEVVSNEVLLEGVTTVKVRVEAEIAVEKVESTDFVPSDPISVAMDGSVVGFNYTPPKLLTSAQLSERQLVWGRYFSSPTSLDRLTLPFVEASASRSPAIGTFEYGLFRSEVDGREILTDGGMVGFRLTSAQAVFNSHTGIVAMAVNDGSLNLNFQDRSFSTELSLSSDQTGVVEFISHGKLYDGGFLRALEATQNLRGAISFDGSEAGYHFEKALTSGTVSGLTLWDSK